MDTAMDWEAAADDAAWTLRMREARCEWVEREEAAEDAAEGDA